MITSQAKTLLAFLPQPTNRPAERFPELHHRRLRHLWARARQPRGRRRGVVHRWKHPAAHRHPRPPRLPPDPEGQVRPRRSLTRCCSNCTSSTSASSPTSISSSAPGSPRSPARPARARRSWSRRSSCWWVVGPMCRSSVTAPTKPRRRPLRRRRARYRGRAHAGRARATAAAAPTSTAGWRPSASSPSAAPASSTSTASTRTRPCSIPRCNAARSTATPASRRSTRWPRTAPRAPKPAPSPHDLASLGGDERARAREVDLLRFQVERDRGGRDRRRRRGSRARAGRGAARRRGRAPRGARARRTTRSKARASTRSARRSTRSPVGRRSPSSTRRVRAAQAELDDVAQELRVASERVADNPERLEQLRRRRQQLRELCRKYGDTLADVMAFGDEAARAARRGGGLRSARGRARSRGRAARGGARPRPPRALSKARADAAPRLAAAIEVHLRELAMPAATVTVDGRARRAHRRRHRPRDVPAGAEPGRVGPPAGQGRVRRRALACDAGGACGPHRGASHAGLRRDRRRDRRRGGPRGRSVVGDVGPPAPGAVRDPPGAGCGICRHAGGGGESSGRATGRGRTHRARSRARRSSTATTASPSSRACSPASVTPIMPAATPASCSSRPRTLVDR